MKEINEVERARAMKEYFSKEELDIINHALKEQLKVWSEFKGYTIWNQTNNLVSHVFRG